MHLMKVRCEIKGSGVSSKPCAWGCLGGWVHRPGHGASDCPRARSWGAGPKLRAWTLSVGTFLKGERDQMLWGKQNVQSSPHTVGRTHFPHWQDTDGDCGEIHFHIQGEFLHVSFHLG